MNSIDWFATLFEQHMNFHSFQDVVAYISCLVPFSLFASFVLTCLFQTIYELINIGGTNGRNK